MQIAHALGFLLMREWRTNESKHLTKQLPCLIVKPETNSIMEPFEINLVGQILTIQPRLDETYDVFDGNEKLGEVHPIAVNGSSRWTSKTLNDDYATQIGELIDEHQL